MLPLRVKPVRRPQQKATLQHLLRAQLSRPPPLQQMLLLRLLILLTLLLLQEMLLLILLALR